MMKILISLSFLVISLFAQLKEVDNKELEKMNEDGVIIIDIRRVDEWEKTGIIENSKLLTFFDEKGGYNVPKWLSDFSLIVKDKNTPFVIYCAHANRTKLVGELLANNLGFKNVYELKGGINHGWINKGMKTVKYE